MTVLFSGGPIGGQSAVVAGAGVAVGHAANTYVMLWPWGVDISGPPGSAELVVYPDSNPLPAFPARIMRYQNSDTTGANWAYIQPPIF